LGIFAALAVVWDPHINVAYQLMALKELRAISARTGKSQQALIAEGLKYVLTKYRERAVAR
jgi:hypothetical protein